ncbi:MULTISPECIES: alpha/beta hydrolase [unclassified Frankia]|uniref:alpha/beta fold hydrolase n=1 Tax=unclassified Frankia TaxID=2632575 RepID=UPI002AD21011|nr:MULTISPECIES: alpha/beta hydrolase [unclassified Frankia]
MQDAPRVGLLAVPGATLYFKVRGDGPVLLMLPGGDGDADATDALAERLAGRYTVVGYDRRGLTRSPLHDQNTAVDVATHSDDAARVLAAVTDSPALVFGVSLGALVGLDLICRHPQRVRLLVAHEPPATELLPERDREQAASGQEEIERLYRSEGMAAAMRQFLALAGVDITDREADVAPPQPKPERIANLTFFLTHDAPAVRRYRLDWPGLHAAADRIVPAAGATSTTGFAHRCAHALAAELGQPLVKFPGGHSGFILRPAGFAARLHEVLEQPTRHGTGAGEAIDPAESRVRPDAGPPARPVSRR